MPNYRDKNLRGGDRSEYLAQYILSAIGVSVHIRREEDYGHDFFCALECEAGRQLTFRSPFTVQTGSVGGKKFVYGTMKSKEKMEHRPMEIAFLRELQLPFFVGTVDKEKHRLRLYSTSAMWRTLHHNEKIGEIELCPNLSFDIDKEGRNGELDTLYGPLPKFRVPLGDPVIDLDIADLDTEERVKAIDALNYAINIEQRNLVYRDIDVRYSLSLSNHRPNEANSGLGYSFPPPVRELERMLDWLRPVMVTLAMAYKGMDDRVSLEKIRGTLELLRLSDEDKSLLRKNAGMEL